ncbi:MULTISPECIES: elongation factor P 5-aminopentanone reductase [Peptoniphilus]|uniref:elongation factor P 5-aminopentanone reductase n=1 Tax=Peptoniphilus TaxID=162289 RepID=UPI0001DA9A50|nr:MULTISPECIES: 3-oxoacyl-ACP reductase FabG [Peptoniphilus]EFI41898.1 oxidoreductase, short chain dehydrogenase/reductase family protein [Peptoniphilus sp. oral taxon 386 str. F0131]
MKTVLITGASRGIGSAIAKRLSLENYNLVLNYNNSEKSALSLRDEIRITNKNCIAIKADVSKLEEVQNMYSEIEKTFGSVDILINNAGISFTGQFQDTSPDIWNKILNTNVTGMYNTIYTVLPKMLSNHEGVILNFSSIWGSHGASCEVAYSTSKGAVESLTKSLAVELAPSNIRVNAISPGTVNTDMMKSYSADDMKIICNEIPMQRISQPEEIAELVCFLISYKNSYMTGQIICADGGMCV